MTSHVRGLPVEFRAIRDLCQFQERIPNKLTYLNKNGSFDRKFKAFSDFFIL